MGGGSISGGVDFWGGRFLPATCQQPNFFGSKQVADAGISALMQIVFLEDFW